MFYQLQGRQQAGEKVEFYFSSSYLLASPALTSSVKYTSNPNLEHGYNKQLKEYEEAEKTFNSFYLVIDNGASERKINNFFKLVDKTENNNKHFPEVIFIDGKLKKSASLF